MKEIPLTQDQVTRVDDEDFYRLNQNPWYAQWNTHTKTFYAKRIVRRDGNRTALFVHREILGLEPGDPWDVHHRDGDTLNNTRENLEVVTRLEHNHLHRDNPRRDASKYGIGVARRSSGRYEAQAQIAGKKHYLGVHDTPEEAQEARAEFLARLREEAA